MGMFLSYTTVPTIETGLAQITQSVNSILETVDALPLMETVSGANDAVATLNETLNSLKAVLENQSTQQLPGQLDKTLDDFREAVKGLTPDSESYQSLNSTLLSLNRTMSNLEILTRTLSEKPNAVLLPYQQTPDPEPEVNE
jgi:paraquat-inducible protein B